MVIYDGGGAVCASLGLEGQRPAPIPRLTHDEFRERLEAVYDDFELGLISAEEFGMLCTAAAIDRSGR